MSSPSARRAIHAAQALLVCATLAGCGFHPLYGGAGQAQTDSALAAVQVEPIPERIGQLVANSLRDSFNPTGVSVAPLYSLKVIVYASHSDLVIRIDGTASRELYVAGASFLLTSTAGGKTFHGTARSNNSYDIGENEYSVVVANDDAQTRAAHDIAQQISQQVSLYMHEQVGK
jgi:LPS-assembly lipoprotein